MPEQLKTCPHGVVAVFVSPRGAVVVATDFDQCSLGGFSLLEAQTRRAKKALAIEVAKAYCAPDYMDAIDMDDALNNLHRLCNKGGRIHIRQVPSSLEANNA